MRRPSSTLPDARFARIRAALPDGEGKAAIGDGGNPGRIQAAVSLIVRGGGELEILLIRRAEAEGDPWSGHMALPGGRRDPADRDLFQTALRETREETDLSLQAEGVPLGRMDPLVPDTRHLPAISIHPFVFGVPESARARVASREVDEVLWTPLASFTEPEAVGSVPIHHDGTMRDFPCYRVGGRVVWGLTFRILQDFLAHLRAGAPGFLHPPHTSPGGR